MRNRRINFLLIHKDGRYFFVSFLNGLVDEAFFDLRYLKNVFVEAI
ncbi:hypothetical protein HCMG_00771 [Helicobacter canadensis MIT 98-5491]|nr:hypothetical protein HCMG_00771 [Helicobacter canadensis MIT 98-5491]